MNEYITSSTLHASHHADPSLITSFLFTSFLFNYFSTHFFPLLTLHISHHVYLSPPFTHHFSINFSSPLSPLLFTYHSTHFSPLYLLLTSFTHFSPITQLSFSPQPPSIPTLNSRRLYPGHFLPCDGQTQTD